MTQGTIAVLTSGGDAPGMNAAVRAIVKVAASQGLEAVGVENGYTGLKNGTVRPLTEKAANGKIAPVRELDFWGSQGGTLLGSARELSFHEARGRAPAVEHLEKYAGLIVIGGNGSLAGAHALSQESKTPIIGIPASIDNDVGCTGTAIGVDTALNTIVEACDRICDTARAHQRAFVVEVMGRDCGYLAMAASVAVGADAALYAERPRSEDDVVSAVEQTIRDGFVRGGKKRVLILKSEGVSIPCTKLVREVQSRLRQDLPTAEVRATVLGHVVRGGSPSFQDRLVAGRLGLAAVSALARGESGKMVAWMGSVPGGTPTADPAVALYPLSLVLEESRALIDGTSLMTKRRVQMMEAIEGVLAL